MRDGVNNFNSEVCIFVQSLGATGSGGKTGTPVDITGYNKATWEFTYGVVSATGATVVPKLLEGDATGSMTTVAAGNLILPASLLAGPAGALNAGTPRAAGVNEKLTVTVGYNGVRKYLSATMPPTVSGGIIAGCNIILGDGRALPSPTPSSAYGTIPD